MDMDTVDTEDAEDMEDTTGVISSVTTDRAITSLATVTMNMEFMDKNQPIYPPGNELISYMEIYESPITIIFSQY